MSLSLVAVLCVCATLAIGDTVSWSEPATFGFDAEFWQKPGTVVAADALTVAVNGEPFTEFGINFSWQTAISPAQAIQSFGTNFVLTFNAPTDHILRTYAMMVTSPGEPTLDLIGLTPGNAYSVQLFANAVSSPEVATQQRYKAVGDSTASAAVDVTSGVLVYMMGTFVATAATLSLEIVPEDGVPTVSISAVVIRALPNCVLVPSVEYVLLGEAGPFPGQRVQVTMRARNVGAGSCVGVELVNALPTGLGYLAGTIVVNNGMQPQTDADDGDAGSYDGANVVVRGVGLASGETVTVAFQAEIGCFREAAFLNNVLTVRAQEHADVEAAETVVVFGLAVVNECTLQATFARTCGLTGEPCYDADTAVCGDVVCGDCPVGYEVNGNGVCVNPDACAQIVCSDVNAYCVDGLGTYTCLCSVGYHDEAGVCVLDTVCVEPEGECSSSDVQHPCCAGYVCSDAEFPDVVPATCVPGADCESGTYQSGMDCVDCTPVEGCREGAVVCTTGADATCEDCHAGYYLNELFLCSPCQEIPGCLTRRCSTATDAICDECAEGWQLNDDLLCTPPTPPPCTINNGGCAHTCVPDMGNAYHCQCLSGYTPAGTPSGSVCVPTNPCFFNNGECNVNALCTPLTSQAVMCECFAGYVGNGYQCELDTCANVQCNAHEHCVNGACVCDAGYASTNGGPCLDINDCEVVDCGPHAHCVDGLQTFTCVCDAGYELTNGGPACTNINDCVGIVCGSHAHCVDGLQSYSCVCDFGYASDNEGPCLNVDDCDGVSCGANAQCVDGVGSYSCVCLEGFTSVNGGPCQVNNPEPNACAVNNGNCGAHADCYGGLNGAPVSCACHNGYFQTGNSGPCVGVNVCATGNGGCDAAHGICSTVVGTWERTCSCAEGWNGPGANGYYCPAVPVDRCLTNNGGCDTNALCYNGFATNSPVTCVCKPGFFASNPSASGPSLVCVGVNVCATANGGCHADARCATTVGTWDKTCTCNEGFTGNGFYCTTTPPTNPGHPSQNETVGWDCPYPPTSFWDWRYEPPTCNTLTVVYPDDLPSGQANDVNVRLHTAGGDVTLNFHNNTGFWSGTTVFQLTAHPNFPVGVSYAVVWVQVGGSNCHWSGSISCSPRLGTLPMTEGNSATYAVASSAGISIGVVGLAAFLLMRRRRKQHSLNERLASENKSATADVEMSEQPARTAVV